jgi:hypothetical protein
MKSLVYLFVCAATLLGAGSVANASIISVDFDGVVTDISTHPPLGMNVSINDAVHGTLVYSTDSSMGGPKVIPPLDGKFTLTIGGHLIEGANPAVSKASKKPPADHHFFVRIQNGNPLLDGAPVDAYYSFAFLFPTSVDVNPPALAAWASFVPADSGGDFGSGNDDYFLFSINSVTVSGIESAPEPATMTIWCIGAIGCAAAAYRRGRKATW